MRAKRLSKPCTTRKWTKQQTNKQQQQPKEKRRERETQTENERTTKIINEGNGISTILFYIQPSGKKINKKNRKQNNYKLKKSY